MIWKNIEIHNVAELTHFEDGSVSWLRLPEAAVQEMEKPGGPVQAAGCTGVELRFVLQSDTPVKIIMSSLSGPMGFNTFHVYRGGMQGVWEDHELHSHVTPEPQEFEFKHAYTRKGIRTVSEKLGLDWDSDVIRVIFDRGCIKLHDVIGDVAPPKPEQLPKRTLLCYGSSITHGSNSIDASHSWPAVLAHNLNVDLRNLGFAGSCAMEPKTVEYIASLGEQDKWHIANLELGINVLDWPQEKIVERVNYTLDQIAGRNPNKPVFVISPFFYSREVLNGCTNGEKWRKNIAQIIAERNDPNVTYINGMDILGDLSGMSGDLIHPNIYGVQQIADRLTAIYKATLKE